MFNRKNSKSQKRTPRRSILSIIMMVVLMGGYMGYAMHIPGCAWGSGGRQAREPVETPDLTQERDSVERDAATIGGLADSVDESADVIDSETDAVRGAVDPDTGSAIEPNLHNINNETRALRDDSAELRRVQNSLEETKNALSDEQRKVDKLESAARTSLAEIESLKDENADLRSKASQIFKEKMAWIGVISVFGIGACIILAFLTRSMTATLIAIGFVITLGVSIAVSLYMSAIAWITIAVAGVAVAGVLGYMGYNTFVQNKSVDELVQTGEVTKNYLSQEARDYIFGRGAEPGVADQVQSKDTKKLVRQIRSYNGVKRKFDLAPREPQAARLPRVPENQTYVLDQAQEAPSY